MEKHQQESIDRLVDLLAREPGIVALILGGSIAHGFATADSDIDVAIVVEPGEYQRRRNENRLVYFNRELCHYEGGYVDGKYMDLEFLRLVAARGSEPARYAFKDCHLLFCRDAEVERVLAEIERYPSEHGRERIERFAAQVLAWKWYYGEAARKQNLYLTTLSVQKLILFGGRIVLAANEMLYPYHKWLLEELKKAARKPEHLLADIETLMTAHSLDKVDAYCTKMLAFAGCIAEDLRWPNQFVRDSEQNWITHEPPIDDL